MALNRIIGVPLILFAGCDAPAPAPAPTTGVRIAFNVLVDRAADNYDIFVMDMDGKNARNITNTPGVEWVYHASGEKLYFLSDRDTCHRCYFLYEMDASGANVRRVFNARLQDSYMGSRMNGTELLIDPAGIRDTAFFRIDRSGQVLDTLYHGLGYANDVSFSPDGKRFVFRGSHAKFKPDLGFIDELFLMDVDGANLRQLTHYPANDTTADWFLYHAGEPRWYVSRAGEERISFISFRKGNHSIFSIRPDGSDERQETADGFDEDWHDWSPDGRYLVYDGTPLTKEEERPVYDIHLMDVHTGQVTRLSTDTLTEQAPVFVEAPK